MRPVWIRERWSAMTRGHKVLLVALILIGVVGFQLLDNLALSEY